MSDLDKLQKLASLVKRGVDGEAKNAEEILRKLLEKEGISIEEFLREDEVKTYYEFRYYNDWDRELLFNIYSMVADTNEVTYCKRKRIRVIWFELTKSQYIEIRYLYDIYMQALRKEFNRECKAFVLKNQIYRKTSSSSDSELSQEELNEWIKIYEKVAGTSFVQVHKAIEKKG